MNINPETEDFFSGKLLLVCKAGTSSGTMVIRLRSQGIPEKILTVPVKKAEIRQGISESAYLPEKIIRISVRRMITFR